MHENVSFIHIYESGVIMISEKIKTIRVMLGLTEVQVSSIIYTSSYIYRLCEKDDSYVTTEMLILLSVIYRISFDWLLSGKYSEEEIANNKYLKWLKNQEQEIIVKELKNNLCLFFFEKRSKANSTTIDCILRMAKKMFGSVLKDYRKSNNMSTKETSNLLCIQETIYEAFESEKLLPSVSQLITIENELNISIGDLKDVRQK